MAFGAAAALGGLAAWLSGSDAAGQLSRGKEVFFCSGLGCCCLALVI